jgi:hypothetical protein
MEAGTLAARNTQLILIRTFLAIQFSILGAAASFLCAQTNLQSGDGYVRREGNEWIMGTSNVERKVRLADGGFYLVSLRNKLSWREYQDAAVKTSEIRFQANGRDVSASHWR